MLFICLVRPAHCEESVFRLCEILLQQNSSAEKAASVSALFAKPLSEALPRESVVLLLEALESELGRCQSVTLSARGSEVSLKILGSKHLSAECLIRVDAASKLISGLQIHAIADSKVQIQSWQDAEAALKSLDPTGQVAASYDLETGGSPLAINSHRFQPIGSTFKLYVLGALQEAIARGEHSWDEVVEIRDEFKSLPSGTMHTRPVGEKFTLREFAAKMISISDNTATDHLIHFLGRERIEQMLLKMGNLNASRNTPLLSTLEMFKLKWAVDPVVTAAFADGNTKTKRALLELLRYVPRDAVGTNGVSMEAPSYVDSIEWFATTNETCRAMFWLAAQNDPEIRQILALETPFVKGAKDQPWSYVGYKGGSEAGVLNMTYLLENSRGQRSCLSVSWSQTSSASPLFQLRFFDIVRKTLEFVQKLSS